MVHEENRASTRMSPSRATRRSSSFLRDGASENSGTWEIAVPSWSHDDDNEEQEEGFDDLYRMSDHIPSTPFTPDCKDRTMGTTTTGSHSSSMTNPNSPHSPLHQYDIFPSSAGAAGGNGSISCYLYHDYDSDSPPSFDRPNSIPLLPSRHGLSERRRSSKNHSSTGTLTKSTSFSRHSHSPTEYSSSADEAADSTPASKRKQRQKFRKRASATPLSARQKRRESTQHLQSTLPRSSSQSSLLNSFWNGTSPPPTPPCCFGANSGNNGNTNKSMSRRNLIMWLLLLVVGGLSVSLTIATNSRIREQQEQSILLLQQVVPKSLQKQKQQKESSLRGNLIWHELERIGTGGGAFAKTSASSTTNAADELTWAEKYLPASLFSWTSHKKKKAKKQKKSLTKAAMAATTARQQPLGNVYGVSRVVLPAAEVPAMQQHKQRQGFDVHDRKLYRTTHVATPSTKSSRGEATSPHRRRTVILHESMMVPTFTAANSNFNKKHLTLYPPDFTDNTQLYGILDSNDERVKTMERRPPLIDGECVPMQEWQTTFYPSCNSMHEVDLHGQSSETSLSLFGTKGYWRNAWRVDAYTPEQHDTLVLKTLKIEHRFEEAHFEHDRIDAVAMERLTSSPHVINIFSFCGHSVMTEYADGNRLGELADKSKRTPLARLRIARDIASGLADVHGIDGDGNATFVHLDINPANVISIGGTLKLNDFNIGIIRKWNTTSNEPCGFPAQYPNPQWRSPEEARNEQNLTEKVDIFSMGHIFFRLICGHEPWHKLEKGGKPSKQEMNEKVQKGILPTIPDFVKKSTSPEVVAIRDAMLKCYEYDPHKRPGAREIATALQKALDKLESQATP